MDFFEPTIFSYISSFFVLIALPFWLTRTVKLSLFYLYLWQIKEYRVERFVDHFRTAQGKQLLVSKVFLGELIVLVLPVAPLLFALYGVDSVKTILDVVRHRVRKPVFTKKIILLTSLNIVAAIIFFVFLVQNVLFTGSSIVRLLVLYTIFVPVIVSVIVVALQPLTILARNRILAKAKAKRETFKNLKVVGITGSYGKTSTKEFLAHILAAKFQVLKTPEHQNTEFGVANTILRDLVDEHDIFVCEMGAYRKGEIKALAEVAQPHIGIVTGVNEQHLATFGSMENLLSAEGGKELVEVLPDNGTVILNGNNEYCRAFYETIKKPQKILGTVIGAAAPITVPRESGVQAENLVVRKDKVSFSVAKVAFQVPAYGGHSVENLALAIAAAKELGMSVQEIAKAAATMPSELSPLKVTKVSNGAAVIDSTYSANPDGVLADLDYLSLYEGRKVLVMPCLIELGSAAREAHERIGKKVAEVCDLAIITTREHFEDIKKGANKSENIVYSESVQDIMGKIKGAGAILLEGGKESRVQRQLLLRLMP